MSTKSSRAAEPCTRKVSVSVTLVDDGAHRFDVYVLTLHWALEALARVESRKGQIVELKFVGGLTT